MVPQRQGLGSLLPEQAWQALLASGTMRPFDDGEVLVRQGDPGTHVLALTSGHVKVSRLEPNGEELLLAVRGPGEVVGDISVLDGTVRSASVLAMGPCVTFALAADRFRRLVREHRIEDVLLRHIISRYREGEQVRAELAELLAPQRVARILARLVAALGGDQPALALTQEELATAAGLSRSATAAELGALRRDGVISTGRRRLVVRDLAALRARAGEG